MSRTLAWCAHSTSNSPATAGAPLGLITTSVQALAGLLLPSASVFLLLLCNDKAVLGRWVNARWLNVPAAVIIAVLLVLSGILVVTTLFTGIDTPLVAIWLGGVMAGALLLSALVLGITRRRRGVAPTYADTSERVTWRVPPVAVLKPVVWSSGTKLGMSAMRGYLVIAGVLLIVKAVQLGSH
ncbi:MAG TPA: hypothetical protein VL551_33405 [Actinospica sp.]|jgi:hypothetical protein|nr:hypothetical protein [Actinospica sp.]